MASRSVVPPPETFAGTIATFVEQYVRPNLPSPEQLVAGTIAVLDYAENDPDPIHIVRGPAKGQLRYDNGTRVVDGDNAAPIWIYLQALDGTQPSDLPTAFNRGDLPVLMALAQRRRVNWKYGRAMFRSEKDRLWSSHLKLAHIYAVGEPGLSLCERFVRNLSPVNHFVFPSPRKYQMVRLGWSELGGTADLGESNAVIACVQRMLLDHIESHAGVYDRFIRMAGATLLGVAPLNARIMLTRKQSPHTATRPVVRELPGTGRRPAVSGSHSPALDIK